METKSHAARQTLKRPGVRELLKQESQHKITMAARELFAELGYDRATLRQIAAKAGLTVGALFNHVSDKRDLIYLVFNEEVDALTDRALLAPRPYQSLKDKILTITEPYFRLFAGEPVLARILLSEIAAPSTGMHMERYLKMRARLFDAIEGIIAEAKERGEIETTENPELIARHIFFTFAASLRWWLAASEEPGWRSGLREYERLLRLQIEGMKPAPAAVEGVREMLKRTVAVPEPRGDRQSARG